MAAASRWPARPAWAAPSPSRCRCSCLWWPRRPPPSRWWGNHPRVRHSAARTPDSRQGGSFIQTSHSLQWRFIQPAHTQDVHRDHVVSHKTPGGVCGTRSTWASRLGNAGDGGAVSACCDTDPRTGLEDRQRGRGGNAPPKSAVIPIPRGTHSIDFSLRQSIVTVYPAWCGARRMCEIWEIQ